MDYSDIDFTRPLSPMSLSRSASVNAADDDDEIDKQLVEKMNQKDQDNVRLKFNSRRIKDATQHKPVIVNDNDDDEEDDLENRDDEFVRKVESVKTKSVFNIINEHPYIVLVVLLVIAFLVYIIWVQHQSGAKFQYVLAAHGLWFGNAAAESSTEKKVKKVPKKPKISREDLFKDMTVPDRQLVLL